MINESEDALLQLSTEFPAAADYLSTILLIERDYGEVHNSQLSNRLGVSKPAVSQAISRLKNIGLVTQESYGTIDLTDAGRRLAETIITRHYLIEHLLIGSIDFPWDAADAEALRLQTVISGDLADHIYDSFGKPSVCPHGNPFPGSASEAELLRAMRLPGCSPGTKTRIVRITEEGEGVDGLLRFCHEHGIRPGVELEVLDVVGDDHVQVLLNAAARLDIPWEYAVHLGVAEVEDGDGR